MGFRKKKELRLVVTFHTTADAMAMEQGCKDANIKGRLIPVPRELSAGCGLAWKSELKDRESIEKTLDLADIDEEGIYECMV